MPHMNHRSLSASLPNRRRRKARLISVATFAAVAILASLASGQRDSAGASTGKALRGIFNLAAGSCQGTSVTGTYFRMIFPHGNVSNGKFFENATSTCSDKTYTLGVPGTQGGLFTGKFQPDPKPAFDARGGGLASAIEQPQNFGDINLSIATDKRDPESGAAVPAPSIVDTKGRLSGQVEAWSIAWKKIFMNQGSLKPGHSLRRATTTLSGTYNASTRAFVIMWTSQVVGGPFNGFTGYWHLEGTFSPKKRTRADPS